MNDGKESALDFFNKWTEEVKKTVPKEKLLIFEAKQGWKPLCEFLQVQVPENDYPRFLIPILFNMDQVFILYVMLLFIGLTTLPVCRRPCSRPKRPHMHSCMGFQYCSGFSSLTIILKYKNSLYRYISYSTVNHFRFLETRKKYSSTNLERSQCTLMK